MFPAETGWAIRGLSSSRERLSASLQVLIEDETWAFNPAAVFTATAEALMWVVVLDDWYKRDYAAQYKQMKTGMGSLLLGLRWARNRTLHDFALLTGFVERRDQPSARIHPGWQHRDVLPPSNPKFDGDAPQYDGRVAGRALLDPVDEVTKWFAGWVDIELKRPAGEG